MRRRLSSTTAHAFAAVLRARNRALEEGRPWIVYVGTPRLKDRRPAVYLRSGYEPRPRGGRVVAWCSVTGAVKIKGPWAADPDYRFIALVNAEVEHDRRESAEA